MSIDLEAVIGQMTAAAGNELSEGKAEIQAELKKILQNEKDSLEILKEGITNGDIPLDEFKEEVDREKLVVQAELLTVKIMAKATAEKAINSAFQVFKDVVIASVPGLGE